MTSTQASAITKIPAESLDRTNAGLDAWARRRKWSRTDTARHLNDRSEPLIAYFRRRQPSAIIPHCRQFGYWLKLHSPAAFDRAHQRLASAADDSVRDRLLPTELL